LATVGPPDNAAGRPVFGPAAGPRSAGGRLVPGSAAGWSRPGRQPVPPARWHPVCCGRPAGLRLWPLWQRRHFCGCCCNHGKRLACRVLRS